MAKKKKSGSRPAAYAKYQYQGPKLTKAQYEYNEEVRKAFRRIKSWERKIEKERGVKIQLDLLPETPPNRATKARIREIREITWQKLGERIKEIGEFEAFLKAFYTDLADLDSYVRYNRGWFDWQKENWRSLKSGWYDQMQTAVADYRAKVGDEGLYRKLKDGETANRLLRAARDLYEVLPSDADYFKVVEEAEEAHNIYFNKFLTALTGEALSDIELRRQAQQRRDEEEYERMRYGKG